MVSKLIFTGGAREKHELAESIVAMNYALEKKVSSGDIFIETSSLTTHENLLNAKPILEREKIESVLVISDALHLKRAMLMAKKTEYSSNTIRNTNDTVQKPENKAAICVERVVFLSSLFAVFRMIAWQETDISTR